MFPALGCYAQGRIGLGLEGLAGPKGNGVHLIVSASPQVMQLGMGIPGKKRCESGFEVGAWHCARHCLSEALMPCTLNNMSLQLRVKTRCRALQNSAFVPRRVRDWHGGAGRRGVGVRALDLARYHGSTSRMRESPGCGLPCCVE